MFRTSKACTKALRTTVFDPPGRPCSLPGAACLEAREGIRAGRFTVKRVLAQARLVRKMPVLTEG